MPGLTPPRISTTRLLLRPLQDSDAAALFAIHSDPEVMRYWNTLPWESTDVAHGFIKFDGEAQLNGRHLCVGIQPLGEQTLIGTCMLFSINAQCRRAELGYGMARAFWGKGLMHEALVAFLSYAFETMNLNRIEADTNPRNLASVKSLERLGFKKEGHLRERWIVKGEASDSSFYGLLKKDWPFK